MVGPRHFAAIGNFDGVHVGHQRLVAETARAAEKIGARPAAVVFDPHPRRYFRPEDPPFLITSPLARDRLLRESGAEEVFSLAFDGALASLSPEAFVFDVLKGRLGLAGVATGAEFRFGAKRAGDAAMLARLCAKAGLEAIAVEPEGGEAKIGSSGVRAAIAEGRMGEAAAMLGRAWFVEGRVEEGRRLGRTIGFPTANLSLGDLVAPRFGVYAVDVELNGARCAGVANFGVRPTVGAPRPLLEVHLFDFAGDLYGAELVVSFMDFIREEKKFDGLDALKAQIARDCETARSILGGAR